jgi:hypothetical protein
MARLNVVPAVMILAALLLANPGYAAPSAWDAPAAAPASLSLGEAHRNAGKSFLDYVRTNYADEPSYWIPATFAGLGAPPRREPATGAMLLASFGLMLYLGSRRKRALAPASP